MGFLDSVKAWFKTEAEEARDLGHKTQGRLNADLDRREADLNATPEQRIEQLQAKMSANDSLFEDMQQKIENREIRADATNVVHNLETATEHDPSDNVLDLESEEVLPPEPPATT